MKTEKLKRLLGKPRSTVGKGLKLGEKIETPKKKYNRKEKHKKEDDI